MTSATEHLARLVAFPTVSRDSNLDLIGYVEAALDGLAIPHFRASSEDGRKANLYATIGPKDVPGIVLSGHTDVVPVDGQAWSSDPFALRTADGRLYARGSADMKGFIACCLAAAPAAAKRKLTAPIHFAFSYDEELGCLGVRRLLDALKPVQPKPRFCIIGEPTSMQVVIAHKGKAGARVIAHGLEGHSSLAPLYVNALHLAMDLAAEVRSIQAEIAARGLKDGDYDVPYTTVHVGRLIGGDAINIVPNRAEMAFEIRYLPGDDPDAILARVRRKADALIAEARKIHPGAGFEFHPLASYPALDVKPDSEVVSFVRALTGGNSTGKITFGTEGGLFQQELGIPSVVCGPGSIAVAHKPDEYIEESQMAACDAFLSRLIDRLSA
ncbi:MAG: acetylornithine deacetylase [Hyphomicrobiales bacterium]